MLSFFIYSKNQGLQSQFNVMIVNSIFDVKSTQKDKKLKADN